MENPIEYPRAQLIADLNAYAANEATTTIGTWKLFMCAASECGGKSVLITALTDILTGMAGETVTLSFTNPTLTVTPTSGAPAVMEAS